MEQTARANFAIQNVARAQQAAKSQVIKAGLVCYFRISAAFTA